MRLCPSGMIYASLAQGATAAEASLIWTASQAAAAVTAGAVSGALGGCLLRRGPDRPVGLGPWLPVARRWAAANADREHWPALRAAPPKATRLQQRTVGLASRCGDQKALVAIANKYARLIWAMLAHDEAYDPPA